MACRGRGLGAVGPSGAANPVEIFVAFFVVFAEAGDVHRVFFETGDELWVVDFCGAADGGVAAAESGELCFQRLELGLRGGGTGGCGEAGLFGV